MLGNPAYPTYQVFLALGIAAVVALLLMPLWIKLMKHEHFGQEVRADGPQRHLVKQGTPTMGGAVILIALVVSCLVMAKPTPQIFLAVGVTLCCGLLGLVDDLTSVTHGRSLGLTPAAKMAGLTVICVAFCLCAVNLCGVEPEVRFPGGFTIDLGVLSTSIPVGDGVVTIPWLYLVFVFLLLAGMSNAVNLTDGLDGLAGGTSMMSMLVMAAISFLSHDANLAIFCAACAGACIGFLWHNCYPASIFMGDTGSLFLGGLVVALAFDVGLPLLLIFSGVIYWCEAFSVILQVISFKTTGKRLFKMSPIHHHFEMCGWSEVKIVTVFSLVAAVFCALAVWAAVLR